MTISSVSLCVCTILLGMLAHSSLAEQGDLTWGQACDLGFSTRCDTSKRLSCDMRSRECKCHHEERDIYNGNADRCETKVGKFCSASDTFPSICVKNAVCDAGTNFCVCEHGSEPNEDGTECLKEDGENFATCVKPSLISVHFALAFMLIGGLWL